MNTFFDGPFENSLFSEKRWKHKSVMVIVPHQDDEINLAGATIRNLVDHGITVYILFCITCDLLEPPAVRVAEGIRSCRLLGVPDENILFLGYCNEPKVNSDLAFYHVPDDTVIISSRGETATYGMPDKPEWCWLMHKTHRAFSRGNFRNDIADVLLTLTPDLIFAVDFDRHPDHRAVSLLFEEAVGTILQRPDNTYFPEIYKGFAYNGSYLGPRDFYANLNICGEVKAEGSFSNNLAFDTDFPPYNWNERVRLPLPRETVSRTLNGNFLYASVRAHFSQGLLHNAKRIFNSDQVFWRRRTDAVSYRANFTVSSGNASYLNDFKLADTNDILALPASFDAGTWVPDQDDDKKEVTITFRQPAEIHCIALYGNAEESSRVLGGTITLSSGAVLPFGPLQKGAKANYINLEEPVRVSRIIVRITKWEGAAAGLTEIQAYAHRRPETMLKIVKLMIRDTFAYDYWIQNRKELSLQLYCYDSSGVSTYESDIPSGYKLICIDRKNYTVNGLTLIPGPEFKQAILRIESVSDPSLYDQIVIRKISFLTFAKLKLTQGLDVIMNRLEYVAKDKYYEWFLKEKQIKP